jgi:hypothetical protein
VTHGTQIVDFCGSDVGNDGNEIGSIAKVTVMQKDLDARLVAIFVDMVDTASVKGRGTPDNAVDLKYTETKSRKRVY